MDKRNIRVLRECNQIPFAIISWIVEPYEITVDSSKGSIIEAVVVLQDEFGFYCATIWRIEQYGDKRGQSWRVKEIDAGKNPEKGLHMTG
ncbi:MAG: hypothetical protein H6Q66_734 [Firmicutes bacterium]|nr:hypothetical protein [Bacillota bacterium]